MHETAFSKLKRKTAEIVFPSRCPFCKAVISGDKLICDTCTKALPQIAYFRFAAGGIPCSAALPYFEEYAGAMKRYKFGKKSDYARAFAFLTVRAARLKFGDQHFDAVACVPMSERAKRKRHFEHAEILAKKCAELLDVPYIEALEKHKEVILVSRGRGFFLGDACSFCIRTQRADIHIFAWDGRADAGMRIAHF